jgi:hypothetical protein
MALGDPDNNPVTTASLGNDITGFLSQLPGRATLDMLPAPLRRDIAASLARAVQEGGVLPFPSDPQRAFRSAIATAITSIESRGRQLHGFLRDGPYDLPGRRPRKPKKACLTDEETKAAITFIYSHVIPCFQGQLAELLAVGPISEAVSSLKRSREMPKTAQLYFGDTVRVRSRSGPARKGADAHVISTNATKGRAICAIAEVKSYHCSAAKLKTQLTDHYRRARRGLVINHDSQPIHLTITAGPRPCTITVVPAAWRLPTQYSWETVGEIRRLNTLPGSPRQKADTILFVNSRDARVQLRWSREALAESAYELALWYMGQLGTVLYQGGVPREWSEMSVESAGRNAVKEQLFHSIRRFRRHSRAAQRAIALYNAFGFGYAVGMNFRGPNGRRGMLWPEDLDEILRDGMTQDGGRIT